MTRDLEKGYTVIFRPRCKMWKCPACADINRRLWAAKATHGAEVQQEQGGVVNFITLTSHEKLNAYSSIKVFPLAWKKLHARATYAGGKQPYLMIPEQHRDGRLHMHAIALWPMTTAWWKDNARECGLGYMAEAEAVRNPALAGWYVVKYITKSLTAMNWPTRFRRIRTSRDWPTLPDNVTVSERTFEPVPKGRTLASVVGEEQDEGRRVLVLEHDVAWQVLSALENEGEFVVD